MSSIAMQFAYQLTTDPSCWQRIKDDPHFVDQLEPAERDAIRRVIDFLGHSTEQVTRLIALPKGGGWA